MVTFRSNNNRRPPFRSNNNRRPPFRSNNTRRPPFRSNNEGSKFSNNDNFRRSVPGRNNHNASKLIEKYNDLAREALAQEDKILSENYFQHADHFTRVQNEQENSRIARANASTVEAVTSIKAEVEVVKSIKKDEVKESVLETEEKKVTKTSEKKIVEKKSATS